MQPAYCVRVQACVHVIVLVIVVLGAAGCKKMQHSDLTPLDDAGMWSASVEELRLEKLTSEEIQQIAMVRHAGVSDQNCIALVRMAHGLKDGLRLAATPSYQLRS